MRVRNAEQQPQLPYHFAHLDFFGSFLFSYLLSICLYKLLLVCILFWLQLLWDVQLTDGLKWSLNNFQNKAMLPNMYSLEHWY